MPTGNLVEPPDFTDVINQRFFIEPQGGPRHPVSYLDSFPNAIYNKSLNSTLVALMYSILGPAGIGALRRNYLLARLAIEDNGLHTADLDALYANPFSFARLAIETYQDNTEGLLTNAQWEKILISDASYRNRALNFLRGARAGGTLQGLTLVAQSGLNRPVELVENYRALYDSFSDDPLGLEFMGQTTSTEEVIVLPRQDLPRSSRQTITVEGNPIKGNFTIAFPFGSETNTTTIAFPFNATFDLIQAALEALPVIGPKNVSVTGGPLPGNPIHVAFTRDLADTNVPALLIVTNTMKDIEENLTLIDIKVDEVGASADGAVSAVSAEDWYYAQVALGKTKPMTAIMTPGKSPGLTKRQIANTTFADSEFVEVLRYVAGLRSVRWPALSPSHWIEGGIEHEAPTSLSAQQHHYTNFHNISNVIAYTEHALEDSKYETDKWLEVADLYRDEHIGPFSEPQRVLYPWLSTFTNLHEEFKGNSAVAFPPTPPTVQGVTENEATNLIEGIYPTEYTALPGVHPIPSSPKLWASKERTEGSDFLEVDLGTVQAVNYIVFDATSKPYDISVSYDVLDQAPKRRFIPVKVANQHENPSNLSIGYNAGAFNPWARIVINFTNLLNNPIFTRFVRIRFTRRIGQNSPFTLINGSFLPYSVEVQNLRIGRNIS